MKDPLAFFRMVVRSHEDPVWFAENVLKVKLFPKQAEILKRFYEGHYKRLIWVSGMRSGKTTLAALIAVYEFFKLCTLDNPQKKYGLLTNEPLFISIAAVSEEQAMDTVFARAKAFVESSEIGNIIDLKIRESKIECPKKNVVIRTISSWSTTGVGRTNKAVVFDELANFEETISKRGAWEMWSRLSKSTDTFGVEGKVIAISSPKHPNDIIMTLYKRALYDDEEKQYTLAVLTPTWEVNPNITKDELLRMHKHDMNTFLRDFACQPTAVSALQFPEGVELDRTLVNVLTNEIVDRDHIRVIAIDPAVKNDAFGIATGYCDIDGTIVVDGVKRFVNDLRSSYISPKEVKDYLDKVFRRLNVVYFVFDTWMFPELIEWCEMDYGLMVLKHVVTKEDFDRWRELQYSKSIRVVHDDVLKQEAESLVVVNERRVDHPVGGSKDLADCVANVIWCLSTQELNVRSNIVVVRGI